MPVRPGFAISREKHQQSSAAKISSDGGRTAEIGRHRRYLRSCAPNAKLVLVGLPPHDHTNTTRRDFNEVAFDFVLATVARNASAAFCPIRHVFANRTESLKIDGLHPTARGYELLRARLRDCAPRAARARRRRVSRPVLVGASLVVALFAASAARAAKPRRGHKRDSSWPSRYPDSLTF